MFCWTCVFGSGLVVRFDWLVSWLVVLVVVFGACLRALWWICCYVWLEWVAFGLVVGGCYLVWFADFVVGMLIWFDWFGVFSDFVLVVVLVGFWFGCLVVDCD